jgi:hypothetical protein
LIKELRNHGIDEILAVCGSAKSCQKLHEYYQYFDGILTECEFWKTEKKCECTFSEFLNILKEANRLANESADRKLSINVYIGTITKEQLEEIALKKYRIDCFFVHCYVRDPKNAFKYGRKERFELFNTNEVSSVLRQIAQKSTIAIRPIFSAEGDDFNKAKTHYEKEQQAKKKMAGQLCDTEEERQKKATEFEWFMGDFLRQQQHVLSRKQVNSDTNHDIGILEYCNEIFESDWNKWKETPSSLSTATESASTAQAAAIEQTTMEAVQQEPILLLTGFQYFDYNHLDHYLPYINEIERDLETIATL